MKNKIFNTLLLLCLLSVNSAVQASTIPPSIITYFKTGNSNALSAYFFTKIELQVLNNENVYSKTQAEQIVKRFFDQNKPVDFVILHQSQKNDSEYAIGTLHTSKGRFRVSFLIKNQDNKQYIYQLSIIKENG